MLKDVLRPKINYYLNVSNEARLSEKDLTGYHYSKQHFHWIECTETDTQGFAVFHPFLKRLDISFRGSQQSKDWINNFNAFHMIYPYDNESTDIRVHRGIYGCYTSVRSQIHKIIKECLKEPFLQVCVTGHSLGGAIATFCLVDLQYNFGDMLPKNVIQGYISGNPKVFNKPGAISFDKRCPYVYRTYAKRDWVPFLPPQWFFHKKHKGYYHCGQPIGIGPSDLFQGLKLWFQLCRNPKRLAENLTNHSIEAYKKWLLTS